MDVCCDDLERTVWEQICDASGAPLQQRWAYGENARQLGGSIARFSVRDNGALVALAQVLVRRVIWRVALLTRGPVWVGDPPLETRQQACQSLRRALRDAGVSGMLMTPDAEESFQLGPTLMTGATTARVALNGSARTALHGKWRNRLVKAEASHLRLKILSDRGSDHNWLIGNEARQRRDRGYKALPPAFSEAWLRDPSARSLTVTAKRQIPMAGMMFLCHGNTATYHLGWTSADGRECAAHTLMLWRAMEQLRDDGVKTLDLGLLDTERTPGLARFKLGAGATAHRLGPTTLIL